MMVFIEALPASLSRAELRSFVTQAMRVSWLGRWFYRPHLKSVDILCITDRDSEHVEYHGLLRIVPDRAAQKSIDRLSRARLRGHPVKARKYSSRAIRDRRTAITDAKLLSFEDRRKEDRRRPGLSIQKVSNLSGGA